MVRFRVDIKRQFPAWEKLSSYQIKGLKVTSKKSVSKRSVLIVIDNPSFLNKALMLFLVLSSADPLLLLIPASPQSLYSSTFPKQIKLDNPSKRYKLISSQILAFVKIPIFTSLLLLT